MCKELIIFSYMFYQANLFTWVVDFAKIVYEIYKRTVMIENEKKVYLNLKRR